MSESSSSSLRCGADIIDLDKYMRSAVRPSREYREQLVVDAGGVDGINRGPQFSCSSDASGPAMHRQPKSKRYSHDSGLSDTSYMRRRQKTHRRIPDASSMREQPTVPPHASPSMQEFRESCEKALREQQQQIARVAQLCERLVQPQLPQEDKHPQSHIVDISNTRPGSKVGQYGPKVSSLASKTGNRRSNVGQRVSDSSDTSDTLSSSLSSEVRQKDKLRSDSCKTYKIIMRKLDDLNRLFVSRPRPPGRAASSGSVSVRDKLVATDHSRTKTTAAPTVQTVLTSRCERPASRLGVTHAAALDIAPTPLPHCYAGDNSGAHDQRSDNAKERVRSPPPEMYDLDNPVHFYEQAKRLQTLHAVTRRGHTVAPQPHEGIEPLPEYRTTEERQRLQEESKRALTHHLPMALSTTPVIRAETRESTPGLCRRNLPGVSNRTVERSEIEMWEESEVKQAECEEWVCARYRSVWRALRRRLPAIFSRPL